MTQQPSDNQGNSYDYITYAGTWINVDNPYQNPIPEEDILRPMLHMRRYNSQVDIRLVTHSLLVARLLEGHGAIAMAYGGVHDFAETMIHDIIHGFKKKLPQYHPYENMWDEYMVTRMGLSWPDYPRDIVKWADMRALVIEMTVTGHGGLPYVLASGTYGGPPTIAEIELFNSLQLLSPMEQWHQLLAIIEAGATQQKSKYNGRKEEEYAR